MFTKAESLCAFLPADHEVMTSLHDLPEERIIGVPAIDDEDRALGILREIDLLQSGDITHLARCEIHEIRDLAAHVKARMELDGSFRFLEFRPVKERKAKIDGCGIERSHGVLERELSLGQQSFALLNQDVEERFVDRCRATLRSPRPFQVLSKIVSPVSMSRRESFWVAW